MTLQRSGGAAAFSTSAEAYAVTMAPSLRPIAERVVARAGLRPGESVLDVGTGTGTAAGLARGEGRRIIGLDNAPGMLAVAAREHPGLELVQDSFESMPFGDESFDVLLAVHALLFSDDRVGALREWLRVTTPGGRLSLSVPGPADRVPMSVLGSVFEAYGLGWGSDYPTRDEIASWATDAGWTVIDTEADPSTAIVLRDDAMFRTWLTVGARGRATGEWSQERRDALARDLMDASPRDDGGYRLPFGTIYLTARRTE